jgi:hypothetical protein
VLGVGLLPVRLWANAEAEGVDFSGLSTQEQQMSPFPVPTLEGDCTDQMHFVSKRVVIGAGGAHRPAMEGLRIELADYSARLWPSSNAAECIGEALT